MTGLGRSINRDGRRTSPSVRHYHHPPVPPRRSPILRGRFASERAQLARSSSLFGNNRQAFSGCPLVTVGIERRYGRARRGVYPAPRPRSCSTAKWRPGAVVSEPSTRPFKRQCQSSAAPRRAPRAPSAAPALAAFNCPLCRAPLCPSRVLTLTPLFHWRTMRDSRNTARRPATKVRPH
uniref:Uncharacterized protein n=1 Tax=Plectus sambesii TaxID=2011161 RepID=A0A914VGL6_9BILA